MNNLYPVLCLILFFCSSCEQYPGYHHQGLRSPRQSVVSQQSPNKNGQISNVAQAQEFTSNSQVLPITARALIKETIFELEVAQTPEQQAKGLMFREALPDNRGMFFPFQQARIARFWMNNVPVALDMIFIKEGKVVAIADSVPPCNTKPEKCPLYGPDTAVDGVIELRSRRAKELGLAIGDSVEISSLDNLPQK
jgi:uncharacterized protein